MGFYQRRVLPRIIDIACGSRQTAPLRRRVAVGLTGQVLEVGFGSGANVPFYPPEVRAVAAVEPSDREWELAQRRLAAAAVPVTRVGLDGQSIPLPDNTCDCALLTWTLCTIPDPTAALLEIRRVVKPGGRLHFVEHGLAPDEDVRRRQYRWEPLNKRVFGGCHLTRQIPDLITGAGFTLLDLDRFYDGAPKFTAAMSLGTAVTPVGAGA
jgi:SAM-dependent methyltransferase